MSEPLTYRGYRLNVSNDDRLFVTTEAGDEVTIRGHIDIYDGNEKIDTAKSLLDAMALVDFWREGSVR